MSAVSAGSPVTVSIAGSDDPIREAFSPLDGRLSQAINASQLTVLSLADGPGGFNILETAVTFTATVIVSAPSDTDTDTIANTISGAIQNATGYPSTSVSVLSVQNVATGNPGAAAPAPGVGNSLVSLLNNLVGAAGTLPFLLIAGVVLIGVIVYEEKGAIVKGALR